MNPVILYEDDSTLAVNKPAGLVVHSDGLNRAKSAVGRTSQNEVLGKTEEKTLVDWLVAKYPEVKNVGEPGRNSEGEEVLRSGIVHRLDRETSGVMLVAKTQNAFENLKKQFQNHKIQKIYHAFVFGEVKNDSGIIDRPIGRSNKDFRMWSAQLGARGEMRVAVTEYKVLNRHNGYSFLEISPKTGRTHQIRVHMKAINYPLVGDSLYAPKKENLFGFKRLALHSYKITFKDTSGKSHTVSAPHPEDFKKAINLLHKT